jgi:hypothetical protein
LQQALDAAMAAGFDEGSDRACLLDDADDHLGVAWAMAMAGDPIPSALASEALRVGARAFAGLDPDAQSSLLLLAEAEIGERNQMVDPLGRFLWSPVAVPETEGELLEAVMDCAAETAWLPIQVDPWAAVARVLEVSEEPAYEEGELGRYQAALAAGAVSREAGLTSFGLTLFPHVGLDPDPDAPLELVLGLVGGFPRLILRGSNRAVMDARVAGSRRAPQEAYHRGARLLGAWYHRGDQAAGDYDLSLRDGPLRAVLRLVQPSSAIGAELPATASEAAPEVEEADRSEPFPLRAAVSAQVDRVLGAWVIEMAAAEAAYADDGDADLYPHDPTEETGSVLLDDPVTGLRVRVGEAWRGLDPSEGSELVLSVRTDVSDCDAPARIGGVDVSLDGEEIYVTWLAQEDRVHVGLLPSVEGSCRVDIRLTDPQQSYTVDIAVRRPDPTPHSGG